jgi:hypothetical protein
MCGIYKNEETDRLTIKGGSRGVANEASAGEAAPQKKKKK